MRVRVLIVVQMALLASASRTELKDKKVSLEKCCDVHQTLAADGLSCVEANWPSNFSIKRDKSGDVVPPLDKEWVRRWLPPGLPMENIGKVVTGKIVAQFVITASPVNASSLWDPALLESEEILRNTVAFLGESFIARPKPGGGYREASYCVDAAPPPLGPFAMYFATRCNKEECAYKCCTNFALMRNNNGTWNCRQDAEGLWVPRNSSLTTFDTELPFHNYFNLCENPRLLPFEERYVEWTRHTRGIHQFLFSTWNTCFEFYRSGNSLHEGVFYCEYPRINRGVYWLLRPLCFLSALLLTASLLSVACNKDMRRKIHGRCLACHAASLFVFNIGQIVYHIALIERLNKSKIIPPDLQTFCKYFSLSMYFVLTASWFWLSALCVNMMRGFRNKFSSSFTKSGTALFYYGPVFCLVLSNIICLVVTLRKVQYLKRGNSVLRREEDQIPLGQKHTEGNNPPTAYTATGNEQTPQSRNRKGTAVDAKTIKLYIKMILISGGIELLTEVIMWVITYENFLQPVPMSNQYS